MIKLLAMFQRVQYSPSFLFFRTTISTITHLFYYKREVFNNSYETNYATDFKELT